MQLSRSWSGRSGRAPFLAGAYPQRSTPFVVLQEAVGFVPDGQEHGLAAVLEYCMLGAHEVVAPVGTVVLATDGAVHDGADFR